jgi:hypothetical protein
MWVTDFFSASDQSTMRNALETVSLVQGIVHSYSSWRRERRQQKRRRRNSGNSATEGAGRGAGRVPRKGASAPSDAHAPLLSAVTRDPVPATHRGVDPATSNSDSADT